MSTFIPARKPGYRSHNAAMGRIARRFPRFSFARGYVRFKLPTDPVYRAVERLLQGTDQPLLDIGCGMGLLGLYLCERGGNVVYLGVDRDARKLRAGRAASAHLAGLLNFQESDANALPAHRGDVAILDVLHYMPPEHQANLLNDAAERVSDEGVLLIRTCIRDDSWRYRLTVIEEWLLHASGWMHASGTRHIPTREQIAAPLRAAGFDVELRPLWGRTPFNSWLCVARRAA
ncbi:MAG: class I SAM-dependent methyltransferase [Rhodanobacteraceae bacterium]